MRRARNRASYQTHARGRARTASPGEFRAGGGAHAGASAFEPDREQRRQIICAAMRAMDTMRESIAPESDLPYPKECISRAILQELVENPGCESRLQLEIAYVQLETFVAEDECRVIEEFKTANRVAQEMAEVGDPASIVKSAGMMRRAKGDRAVGIQEKISRKMRDRSQEIKELGQRDPGAYQMSAGWRPLLGRKNSPKSLISKMGLL